MLVQRCTLDQHRLILPISLSKPTFTAGSFSGIFKQNHYRALVDTGAQRTVVARSVIAEQDLMRTGHMEFSGLHGQQTHTRYLALVGLWARRVEADRSSSVYEQNEQSLFTIEDPIEIVNMENNKNFDVILGFDVLKRFSFEFDQNTKLFEIVIKP